MPRSRFLSYASNVNGHNYHNNNNDDISNVNARPTDTMNHTNTMTLPMLSKPASTRNNITAFLGEFVGTFLFLFFSFAGTQIAVNSGPAQLESGTDIAVPNTQNLMFIALVFGLSLMANVWAFYRVTGGLFNPSVTLALFLVGGLSAIRSVIVVVAQLLAGMAAAGVVSALFPGPMDVETTLGGGANVAQGLFIEMFLTAELVFVVIMVAAEKHKSTYLAPVAIGMAFFLAELVGKFAVKVGWKWNGMLTADRRILHRRLSQLCPLPRTSGGQPELPRLFLDLLPGPHPGLAAGLRILCAAQVPPVEGVQPRPGCR